MRTPTPTRREDRARARAAQVDQVVQRLDDLLLRLQRVEVRIRQHQRSARGGRKALPTDEAAPPSREDQ